MATERVGVDATDVLMASGFPATAAFRVGAVSAYSSRLIVEHLRVLACVGCGKKYRSLYSAGWRECARHPSEADVETGVWPCCHTRSRATLASGGILFPLNANNPLYNGCRPCDHHDDVALPPVILSGAAYNEAVILVAASKNILPDGPIGHIHEENTKKFQELLQVRGYELSDCQDVIVVSSR
jgi:hypothetical protein